MARQNSFHPLLIDKTAACRLLSISPRKLWSLTASGDIPKVRIGRSVRYDVRDIEAYIEQQKQGGAI